MIGKMQWLLLCVGILTSISMRGADQYQVGDTLYLWCKRGFKLRERPAMDAKVISVLSPGKQVIVIGKTDIPMHIHGFWKNPRAKALLPGSQQRILYGSWVCVRTEAGDVGFVLDQYLLKLRPNEKGKVEFLALKLQVIERDTISRASDQVYGYLNDVRIVYEGEIEVNAQSNTKGSDAWYFFPMMSIEEVLIIFRYSGLWSEYSSASRSWKNEMRFHGTCDFVFIQDEDGVIVTASCYC